MLADLVAPNLMPFVAAAGILAGLVLIEIATLLIGVSGPSALGHAIDHPSLEGHDPGSDLASLLGWLNVGRVPLLVLFMLWLAAFAIAGLVLAFVLDLIGVGPSLVVSVPGAIVIATLATRPLSGGLGRLLPSDESYVVDPDSFTGALAEVTVGPVRADFPGRVKVRDPFGNWHFPIVQSVEPAASFAVGDTVMILGSRPGALLVSTPDPRLTRKSGQADI